MASTSAGAALPFGNGYRFPVRLAPWCNVLRRLQPDLIEVGDPYLTAWAALEARRKLDVPVIGFYHSDLPLLVSNRMGNWFTPTSRPMSANCTATSTACWRPAK